MYRSRIFFGGLALAMIITSLWVAGPVSAATPGATGGGGIAIAVHAQDTNSGQAMVDSMTAPADGWLLIRRDANGAPGGVIGWAAVHQGVNSNVVVDLRTSRKNHDDDVTATLWATFAADPNATSPFAAPDSGLEQWMGGPAVAFSSTAAGGASTQLVGQALTTSGKSSAPSALKFAVRAQDTNNAQVMVDSVTAPADGWLLIRRDANGAPGGVIGWAPVHQGVNQNVGVDLRAARKNHDDDVTATLWATFAADPNATSPFAAPDSGLEQWMGGPAAAFSSTAAGGATP